MLRPTLIAPPPSVLAICPYFSQCGGCECQDVSYKDQLNAKQQWLTDLFAPLHPREVLPILGSGSEYPTFFRNKIRFSFIEHDGMVWPSRHPKGSSKADIPIEQCFLHSEEANRIIRATAAHATTHNWSLYNPETRSGWLKHLLIRQGKATGELMVVAITDQSSIPGLKDWIAAITAAAPVTSIYQGTSWGRELTSITDVHLWGETHIHEKVGDYTFAISPQAFFQTNSEMVTTLYSAVARAAGNGACVWDLYAGSATIGCYLSKQFGHVHSIESNESNVADGVINVELNSVTNLTQHPGLVEEVVSSAFIREHGLPDCVVVDPPRAGLHQRTRQLLGSLGLKKLVYVSCNPLTALRDITELTAAGYTLTALQPIDMFPHSWHAELVAVLTK
ncbi:23S rRNA (uracil(1939)-C(5))-methyltransferase RlmD [soil metagenome]